MSSFQYQARLDDRERCLGSRLTFGKHPTQCREICQRPRRQLGPTLNPHHPLVLVRAQALQEGDLGAGLCPDLLRTFIPAPICERAVADDAESEKQLSSDKGEHHRMRRVRERIRIVSEGVLDVVLVDHRPLKSRPSVWALVVLPTPGGPIRTVSKGVVANAALAAAQCHVSTSLVATLVIAAEIHDEVLGVSNGCRAEELGLIAVC